MAFRMLNGVMGGGVLYLGISSVLFFVTTPRP